MNNKKSKFLLSLTLVLTILTLVGSVSAKDIAYVTKNEAYTENSLIQIFNTLGYDYDVIYQNSLGTTDFSNYKMIVVGEGVFTNPSLIPVNQKNSVIFNTHHLEEWGWTGRTVSIKSSNYPSTIYVQNTESFVARDIPSSFIPYTTDKVLISYNLRYISKFYTAPGMNIIVADGANNYNGGIVTTLNKGAVLRGGKISNARGVFIGFVEMGSLTEHSKKLISNSIIWALERDGNHPPEIQDISKISVHETELVEVYVIAYDSEDDEISYALNDSRFTQDPEDPTHFTWQTGYEDEGDYNFFITASDKELSSTKKFSVKVWNKNKAPELLMEIPTQEWNEDTTHTLDLTQYFYDLDGDTLYYLFSESSDESNIILQKIESGVVYFKSQKDWYGEDWIIFKAGDGINTAYTNNISLRVLPVNDAPKIINKIEYIEIDEDNIYEIILENWVYDPDSELIYSFESTSPQITIELNEYNTSILITPKEDWYGEGEIRIKISDGELEIIEIIPITVNSVNDAPRIQEIEKQFILAGGLIKFSVIASDIEGDKIELSINDSRFTQDNNNFEWQTTESDFGEYKFIIKAYDGQDYSQTIVQVSVMQKIFINEIVTGSEGWIELYNPEESEFILEGCVISNGTEEIMLYGILDKKGFSVFGWNALKKSGYLELSCNGIIINTMEYQEFNEKYNSLARIPDASNNWKILDYPTKGVSNTDDVTKPEVELETPYNNTIFNIDREVLFEFYVKDNLAEEIECSIIINNIALETSKFENNTIGSFYIDYLKDGIHTWNIECNDGSNKNKALEDWKINIDAPDNPILSKIGNKEVSENTELKFTISATDQDKDTLTLYTENLPEGSTFTDTGKGRGTFTWTPDYTQSGIYKLTFIVEDNTGLKDSEEITITVKDAKEPPKFTDAEKCSLEDKNDSIQITIKKPGKKDSFEIGETINGNIRLKNKLDDDSDFDIEIYLYDIKEEESIEIIKESVFIRENGYEDIDFTIKIPSDIENSEFVIYVHVESEDGWCNTDYIETKIEREKHKVIISDIVAGKKEVSPGEELGVKVKIENIGKSNENVFITLEIPSLGIHERSEEIKIEKYGGEDKESKLFNLKLPDNAQYGLYDLKVSIDYRDESDSKLIDLIVSGSNKETEIVIPGNPIILNKDSGSVIILGGSGTKDSSNTNEPIILSSGSSKETSKTNKLSFTSNSINLGVNEKPVKETLPNVKVMFEENSKKTPLNASKLQWVILAIILGLTILIIIAIVVYIKRNPYQ